MNYQVCKENYLGLHRGDFPLFFSCLIFVACSIVSCQQDESVTKQAPPPAPTPTPPKVKVEGVDYFLPRIDLKNWKVTLPIGNPTEVSPPEILSYATSSLLRPFMYNDSTDGGLVFYAYPGSTTTNTVYSRTELREQLQPGSNSVNWTFLKGGAMTGTLSVTDVSKDASGKFHKVIVMQIHGILTEEQRALIGASGTDAPPVLKISWESGKVKVHTKELINFDAPSVDILKKASWADGIKHTFAQAVEGAKFTLKITASDGKLVVTLNDAETFVYENDHMKKWSVFNNYFKAGNYLLTTDGGAHAKVKYYTLAVSH